MKEMRTDLPLPPTLTDSTLPDSIRTAFTAYTSIRSEPWNGISIIAGEEAPARAYAFYVLLGAFTRVPGTYAVADHEEIFSLPKPPPIRGNWLMTVVPEPGLTYPEIARDFSRNDPSLMAFGDVPDATMVGLLTTLSFTGHRVIVKMKAPSALDALITLCALGGEDFPQTLGSFVLCAVGDQYEMITITHELRTLLLAKASTEEVAKLAREQGYVPVVTT